MKTRSLLAKEKLKKACEFRQVFSGGRKINAKTANIYYCPNHLAYSRLGVVVSAKTEKSAARRNRIKRLVREAYRNNKIDIAAGVDIVVVKKPQPGGAPLEKDFGKEIAGLLKGIKIGR